MQTAPFWYKLRTGENPPALRTASVSRHPLEVVLIVVLVLVLVVLVLVLILVVLIVVLVLILVVVLVLAVSAILVIVFHDVFLPFKMHNSFAPKNPNEIPGNINTMPREKNFIHSGRRQIQKAIYKKKEPQNCLRFLLC